VLAVLIFWEALILVLGTDTPISGIATCSMKPNMNRGDLIILQNGKISAPVVLMEDREIKAVNSTFSIIANGTRVDGVYDGSLYSMCLFNKNNSLCKTFVTHPNLFSEAHGPLIFNYGHCKLNYDGTEYDSPCVVSVSVGDTLVHMTIHREIIAYRPKNTDVFHMIGDISHRVQFGLKSKETGKLYYVTKGDNNQIFDVQMFDYATHAGNSLVNESQVKGKVIFRIPYIGYYKLFLSGMFGDVSQCHTVLSTPGFS